MSTATAEPLTESPVTSRCLEDIFAESVRSGLSATPRFLPSAGLYAGVGSRLYESVCGEDAYTLPRREADLWETRMLTGMGLGGYLPDEPVTVIEMGAGCHPKTLTFLEFVLGHVEGVQYVPLDVSIDALHGLKGYIMSRLARFGNRLCVTPMCGFNDELLASMDRTALPRPTLLCFHGSSLGNELDAGMRFVDRVAGCMRPGDLFLLTLDCDTDIQRNKAAYSGPLTKRWYLNYLASIRSIMGAAIPEQGAFEHEMRWNDRLCRVEAYLVARKCCEIRLPDGTVFRFNPGDDVFIECSQKYDSELIDQLIRPTRLETLDTFWGENIVSVLLRK